MPDKKFEKDSKGKKILKNNKINKIIKLPENVFSEGITTSIFIIEAGIPQGDNEIFTCYIKEDGLVTVKNQGRQDIKEQWQEIENYWINIIKKQHGDSTIQWINSKKYLSYQLEVKPFEVSKEDFKRTAMDYIMFKNNINKKDLNENLLDLAMYSSDIEVKEDKVILSLKKIDDVENKKNEF